MKTWFRFWYAKIRSWLYSMIFVVSYETVADPYESKKYQLNWISSFLTWGAMIEDDERVHTVTSDSKQNTLVTLTV